MNVGKASAFLAAFVLALFLIWEFVVVPAAGVEKRQQLQQTGPASPKR